MAFLELLTIPLHQAASSLTRHKLRSFLTILCISWGVAALMLVTSICEGFREGQRQKLAQFGEGMVSVWGGRTESQAGGQRAGRNIQIYRKDLEAIRTQCPAVGAVAGQIRTDEVRVVGPAGPGKFPVLGVDPDYLNIRLLPVEAGRTIQWLDVHRATRVCVIGWSVQDRLFDNPDAALGATITLNGQPYRIVGIRGEEGQLGSKDGIGSDEILVPFPSAERDCPPSEEARTRKLLSTIAYRPADSKMWEEAQDEVRATLARIHDFDPEDPGALRFWDTQESARTFNSIIGSIETFLSIVALVTLSLGAVSVMNIMMISVAERTREIGLRKAVGATRRRVLFEILVEGAFLALIGGPMGLAIVALLTPWVNSVGMSSLFVGMTLQAQSGVLTALALGVAAVVSAFPPAWRAARLTPVEALREEQ